MTTSPNRRKSIVARETLVELYSYPYDGVSTVLTLLCEHVNHISCELAGTGGLIVAAPRVRVSGTRRAKVVEGGGAVWEVLLMR
jgi:hypothetical protein